MRNASGGLWRRAECRDYGSAIIPPSYRLVGRMTPPMPVNPHEVPIERLQWACGTQGLQFHCTNEVTPLEGFVGQDRAISAIEFGLGLRKAGYNLFVTGMSGTGKASAIKEYVQRIVADRLGSGDDFDLHDWCYLHNFSDTDRPAVLQLLPGQGRVLREKIADLLAVVRDEVPKVFAGDTYTAQRKQLEERGRARHQEAIRQLESHVSAAGFAVEFGSNGVNLFPMRNGQPLPLPEYRALSEDQRAIIDSTRERLMTEVQRAMEAIQQAESEARSDTVKLDTRVSSEMLEGLFRALRVDYASTPPVRGYLDSLFVHTLSNMASFRQRPRSADGEVVSTEQSPAGGTQGAFLPYEINLLVDNGSLAGAPIVVEPNPTWGNLFRAHRAPRHDGRIYQRSHHAQGWGHSSGQRRIHRPRCQGPAVQLHGVGCPEAGHPEPRGTAGRPRRAIAPLFACYPASGGHTGRPESHRRR